MWETLVGPVSALVNNILNRVLPATKMSEAEQADVQTKVTGMLLTADTSVLDNMVKVLTAEMNGNWLQRSWRPILMLTIISIVANNYVIYPYLALFGIHATPLELPPDLWALLKLGVSGYVVGRSAEKITTTVMNNKNK